MSSVCGMFNLRASDALRICQIGIDYKKPGLRGAVLGSEICVNHLLLDGMMLWMQM